MLRSIIIIILMCSTAHQSSGTPVKETIFSHVIETRLPNPITVVMDSTLYIISKTNRTISITSSEATCKLAVDPFDENIQDRIRAVPLPGARKILVWGVQSSNQGLTFYTLLMVDPLACSYKVIPLPEDQLPAIWPALSPQIVAYDKIFYVFFPSHRKCAPCSFDSNGENTVMSRNRQLHPQSAMPLINHQFWIKEFYTNNYKYLFHAYNFENGSALIELVDDYWFKSQTAVYLDHAVDAASVKYGTYQNTAICHISPNDAKEVTCSRLNSRLVPGMTWKLPMRKIIVLDVFIEIDGVGNTFIGTIDFRHQLRFFVYNVDGQLTADLDFGKLQEVDNRFRRYEVNGIRLGGDEYCLEAVTYDNRSAQETRHAIKCVDVKKYIQ